MRDVGIVMPVYKQDPNYLRQALRSVLNQTYNNFHFVIVSDGAPKETVKIIREIIKGDTRTKLILKNQNEGVANALNTGFSFLINIDEVKYLTWVSSDNIYYPGFIEKLRKVIDDAPDNVGLVYSSFRHIDDKGNYLNQPKIEAFIKYQNQPKDKLLESCFIGVSFMYKKRDAAKVGGYSMEPVEDYEYWLRLTDVCDIKFLPEVLMEYRTDSPLSISAKLKSSQEHHRNWRYYYNLAKHQARIRRNIPVLLTVIFPVGNQLGITVKKLDDLLEQTFSNYELLIIDCSAGQRASRVIQNKVKDPRLKYIHLPGVTEKAAIQQGIRISKTPLSLVYGHLNFPESHFTLINMINYYNGIQGSLGNKLGYYKVHAFNQIMKGKVYETSNLKQAIK